MRDLDVCSVDTLLADKDCTTNLKEWVEYNLNDFPGLKDTINSVILKIRNDTKVKPLKKSDSTEDEVEYALETSSYEQVLKQLSNLTEFITNNHFYVIDSEVETSVIDNKIIKFYWVTISVDKEGKNTLTVNYDLLSRRNFSKKKH